MTTFLRAIFGTVADAQSSDMNDVRTGFLYALPSFLSGYGRVLDLFGGFDEYCRSRDEGAADSRAMYADWRIVGQDIYAAAIRPSMNAKQPPTSSASAETPAKHFQSVGP